MIFGGSLAHAQTKGEYSLGTGAGYYSPGERKMLTFYLEYVLDEEWSIGYYLGAFDTWDNYHKMVVAFPFGVNFRHYPIEDLYLGFLAGFHWTLKKYSSGLDVDWYAEGGAEVGYDIKLSEQFYLAPQLRYSLVIDFTRDVDHSFESEFMAWHWSLVGKWYF